MKSWAMEMDLSPTHEDCPARAPCKERSPPPLRQSSAFLVSLSLTYFDLCFLGMVSQVARDATINRSTRRGDVLNTIYESSNESRGRHDHCPLDLFVLAYTYTDFYK